MEQKKSTFESTRDKYFPRVLDSKNSYTIATNLEVVKERFRMCDDPEEGCYSDFLIRLIYVACVPQNKRVNPDPDPDPDESSFLCTMKDGFHLSYGLEEDMAELRKFRYPTRVGYLNELIEGILVVCDTELISDIFLSLSSIKECETTLKIILEKTKIQLDPEGIAVLLNQVNKNVLVALLLSGFSLPASSALEVLASIKLKSALGIYIHRPDLRDYFSDGRKMFGRALLDKRGKEVEPHIPVEAVIKNVLGDFL